MEPRAPDPRRARARRAYELGRLRSAAWTALAVAPFVACALLASDDRASVSVLGAALYALAAALFFRGQVYGSAVGAGLVAGAAPMLAPLLFRKSGHCCIGGACWSGCMIACFAGGLAAGLVIGWLAAKRPDRSARFWLAAASVATLTGSLGCAVSGLAGTLAMMTALVAASVPVLGVMRGRA